MTLDRARLAALLAEEERRFHEAHPRSLALFERARRSLLGGVPMHWMVRWAGGFPLFVTGGEGAHLTDVDGHRYLDLCLGDTGAMTGHAPAATVEAVRAQAERGFTFMLPTEDAVWVGEELARRFGLPYWQFAVTATDANRFALRLARHITGRPKVLVFNWCYHGTVDETFATLQDGRTMARDRTQSSGREWFSGFSLSLSAQRKSAASAENLARLETKATSDSFGIAKFYDKQKNYRAAIIYYNDVIRQQPGSAQGDEAKNRIDELRSKVGDAEVKQILAIANAPKKKPTMAHAGESQQGGPAMRSSPTDVAPLPPPEDVSLPPPASLSPVTTTAPAVSPTPARRLHLRAARRRRREVFSRRGIRRIRSGRMHGLHTSARPSRIICATSNAISIPTFKNSTLHPRIEVLVTSTVIKQFQQDGTFRIVGDEDADATLKGEITSITRVPTRSVRGNVLATTEFGLTMRVRYSLVDRAGKQLAPPTYALGTTSFFVSRDVNTDERRLPDRHRQSSPPTSLVTVDWAEGW